MKTLIRIGRWSGLGAVVVLSGYFLLSPLGKTANQEKPAIYVQRGIEQEKAGEDAIEHEKSVSPKETYHVEDRPEPSGSPDTGAEEAAADDAGRRQAEDWLNKFLPMLKKKGLIARIDDAGVYTLYVSGEWDKLSEDNKNKIIENTSFALKFFGKNPQVTVKDKLSKEVLGVGGETGVDLYR